MNKNYIKQEYIKPEVQVVILAPSQDILQISTGNPNVEEEQDM